MSVLPAVQRHRDLGPVHHPARWIAWGLALQAIGVGIPVVTALHRARESSVGGAVTHYTVRLIWHEMLRSRAGVALIVLGVLLFAAGAVMVARPFVRRRATLLLAVPLSAVAGLAVFGVIALVCAVVVAATADVSSADWGQLLSDLPIDWPGDGRRRK